MKKAGNRFAVIPVLAMILSLLGAPALAAAPGEAEAAVPAEYALSVDGGAKVSLWAYELGGSAYFKLRDIAMALDGTGKQFDIGWEPEHRIVELAEGIAYTPVGGEFSRPERTGNAEAQFTDCSIRSRQDWGNILAYLIDGSHYVKLSDLGAVTGFSSECDQEADTVRIDTTPEAVLRAVTGEVINNIAVTDAGASFALDENGTVIIRYAGGIEAEAPVSLEPAGSEAYTGRSLDEAGFYISEERTAVAYCDADGSIRVVTSGDRGESWEESEVLARNLGAHQMYLGFNSPSDGWLVICQFHGMGSESHYIYRTSDGGTTWTQTGNPNDLYARILTGAGYAAGDIGFLCFRFESDDFRPAICRTKDGGLTWEKIYVEVPEDFDAYYSGTALSPVFNGADGILPVILMNNDGDTLTIHFTTDDCGDTWTYSPE